MKLKRPLLLLLLVFSVIFTAGCSVLDTVNSSLDYVNEATSYVNNATEFANNLPTLAEQALLDPAARDSLQQSFETMKTDITQFNELTAPGFAEDVHQTLVGYNETLLTQVNTYLEQIQNNVIDLEALQQSPIIQTLGNITDTLGQLSQLGQ
ncbi:DUF6376 family protein [Paenibacillus xanthanilyticus]|uniref:DUF6376 family protein n=1 Tax=Paenibacillus xanthanilyticus TaxID=1783531 RepID=A0ABV8K0B8_9BACL